MFSRIVVGTDGSSTARGAVAVAAGLAKEDGATLHLVNAYQQANAAVSMAFTVGAAGAASLTSNDSARAAADSVLEAAAAELRADGVHVELHAVPGPAADAIVGVAQTVDADVIVVGSRGMQGARRMLGSVPNSVAHRRALQRPRRQDLLNARRHSIGATGGGSGALAAHAEVRQQLAPDRRPAPEHEEERRLA